jgi:hypothetical protein
LSPVFIAELARAQAAPVFTPDRFRAHVEFLADDLLEGRETGTRGYDIAARYVATQFEAYGLKPGGANGSWYQPVTFQMTTRGNEPSWLSINGPGGEQRFNHKDNVLVWMNSREANYEISAPLVFAGYGIEDQRLGIDDYRGLDVKGKIVVVLRGFPKGTPSEEGAHLSAEKARVAERHGAIGMIGIATLQSEKVMPWKRILEYADDPGYAWVGADGKAHEEAPGVRGRATLNGPAADAVFAGSARYAGGHPPGSRPREGQAARLRTQDPREHEGDQQLDAHPESERGGHPARIGSGAGQPVRGVVGSPRSPGHQGRARRQRRPHPQRRTRQCRGHRLAAGGGAGRGVGARQTAPLDDLPGDHGRREGPAGG